MGSGSGTSVGTSFQGHPAGEGTSRRRGAEGRFPGARSSLACRPCALRAQGTKTHSLAGASGPHSWCQRLLVVTCPGPSKPSSEPAWQEAPSDTRLLFSGHRAAGLTGSCSGHALEAGVAGRGRHPESSCRRLWRRRLGRGFAPGASFRPGQRPCPPGRAGRTEALLSALGVSVRSLSSYLGETEGKKDT